MANYLYITANGNYQITTGPTKLRHIVNGSGNPNVTFYDTATGDTAATNVLISTSVVGSGTFGTAFAGGGDASSGVWFDKGLYITVTGTAPYRMTILYD